MTSTFVVQVGLTPEQRNTLLKVLKERPFKTSKEQKILDKILFKLENKKRNCVYCNKTKVFDKRGLCKQHYGMLYKNYQRDKLTARDKSLLKRYGFDEGYISGVKWSKKEKKYSKRKRK